MSRLALDPRTRALMGDFEFQKILREVQSNPASMTMYMQNPKFQLVRGCCILSLHIALASDFWNHRSLSLELHMY